MAVCGDMGSQALQAIEDLYTKIQRGDGQRLMCAAAQNATDVIADYMRTVSNQMVVLKNEVISAYRMRDLYEMRRLSTQKLMVVVRGKIIYLSLLYLCRRYQC